MNKGLFVFIFVFLLFSSFVFAIKIEECEGCIVGEKCVNHSVRRAGLFCENTTMKPQFRNEESCSNDYECLSRNCLGGLCKTAPFPDMLLNPFAEIWTDITNADEGVEIISYIDDADATNMTLHGCTGCFDDKGSCVGISYRAGGKFCDRDQIFKPQKKRNEPCLANYQCKSNECMRDNTCRSTGFFRSIFMWIDGNS